MIAIVQTLDLFYFTVRISHALSIHLLPAFLRQLAHCSKSSREPPAEGESKCPEGEQKVIVPRRVSAVLPGLIKDDPLDCPHKHNTDCCCPIRPYYSVPPSSCQHTNASQLVTYTVPCMPMQKQS